jgi:hypothetical protein
VEFPSVIDRVLGFRAAGNGYVVVVGSAPSWCVEVGDAELFGIAGLRVSGARASGRAGDVPLALSVAQLVSPVGDEARVDAELGYAPGSRWSCAARVGVETVSLVGTAREDALVTGMCARANAGHVSVVADVDVVSRTLARDIELTFGVVARAGSAACVVASARFEGSGVAGAGVSLVSRIGGALSLLAGYDDGTESIRGAAVISLNHWRVSTGVYYHGVLGVSQAVTIAWTR